MKITIDTKEDSPREIKNIIKMLSSLVGEKIHTNQPNIFEDSSPEVKPAAQRNIFEDSSPEVKPSTGGNIFGNMFDNPQSTPSEKTQTPEEPKIEEKEETFSISEYF